MALLGAAWLFGAANAVRQGFKPGYYNDPRLWGHVDPPTYPWLPVAVVLLVIAVETAALYAVLRPRSYDRSWLRMLGAGLLILGLLYLDLRLVSGWNHQPGYMYANSQFLFVAFLPLSLGFAMQMLEAGHRRRRPAPS